MRSSKSTNQEDEFKKKNVLSQAELVFISPEERQTKLEEYHRLTKGNSDQKKMEQELYYNQFYQATHPPTNPDEAKNHFLNVIKDSGIGTRSILNCYQNIYIISDSNYSKLIKAWKKYLTNSYHTLNNIEVNDFLEVLRPEAQSEATGPLQKKEKEQFNNIQKLLNHLIEIALDELFDIEIVNGYRKVYLKAPWAQMITGVITERIELDDDIQILHLVTSYIGTFATIIKHPALEQLADNADKNIMMHSCYSAFMEHKYDKYVLPKITPQTKIGMITNKNSQLLTKAKNALNQLTSRKNSSAQGANQKATQPMKKSGPGFFTLLKNRILPNKVIAAKPIAASEGLPANKLLNELERDNTLGGVEVTIEPVHPKAEQNVAQKTEQTAPQTQAAISQPKASATQTQGNGSTAKIYGHTGKPNMQEISNQPWVIQANKFVNCELQVAVNDPNKLQIKNQENQKIVTLTKTYEANTFRIQDSNHLETDMKQCLIQTKASLLEYKRVMADERGNVPQVCLYGALSEQMIKAYMINCHELGLLPPMNLTNPRINVDYKSAILEHIHRDKTPVMVDAISNNPAATRP